MKWECPVCRQREQKEDICSNCGFDRTLNLEKYDVIGELSRENQKVFLENYKNSRKIAKEKGGVLWEKLEEQQEEIKKLKNEVKEKENKIAELENKKEKIEEKDPIVPPVKKSKLPVIVLCAAFFACGGAAGGYWGTSRVTQIEKNDTQNDQNKDDIIESETASLAQESSSSVQESETESAATESETTVSSTKELNTEMSDTEKLSIEAPIIEGVEDGKVYCEEPTVTVKGDDVTVTVTINGKEKEVALSEDGTFVVEAATSTQTITAMDKAGNTTSIDIVVNGKHIWNDDKGICTVCGEKIEESSKDK